jgi:hypothetical protein
MTMPDHHAPKEMLVECPGCDKVVTGRPRGWMIYDEPREGPPERWTLLECMTGQHPILVIQNDFGPRQRFDDDNPYRIYPPQDPTLSDEIPHSLRDIHQEARKCFHAKAYKATAAMSGQTIEGACKLHGVTKGVLRDLLAEMKKQELIDGRLWEWAETLRHVRNAASHFDEADDEITRQDAEDALAFSEALLDYLYVLKARFDALKARRGK